METKKTAIEFLKENGYSPKECLIPFEQIFDTFQEDENFAKHFTISECFNHTQNWYIWELASVYPLSDITCYFDVREVFEYLLEGYSKEEYHDAHKEIISQLFKFYSCREMSTLPSLSKFLVQTYFPDLYYYDDQRYKNVYKFEQKNNIFWVIENYYNKDYYEEIYVSFYYWTGKELKEIEKSNVALHDTNRNIHKLQEMAEWLIEREIKKIETKEKNNENNGNI